MGRGTDSAVSGLQSWYWLTSDSKTTSVMSQVLFWLHHYGGEHLSHEIISWVAPLIALSGNMASPWSVERFMSYSARGFGRTAE